MEHNGQPGPPCDLSELLRRTLSLIEYYGNLHGRGSELFELKLAFIRAIERIDADEAAKDSAAKGIKLDHLGFLRKGPHGETIDTTHLDKELDKKL